MAEPQVWPGVPSRPGTGRDGRAALFRVVFLVAFLVEGHIRATTRSPNGPRHTMASLANQSLLARFCGVGQTSRCDSRSTPRTLTPTDASAWPCTSSEHKDTWGAFAGWTQPDILPDMDDACHNCVCVNQAQPLESMEPLFALELQELERVLG